MVFAFLSDLMPMWMPWFSALPREDRACWVGGGAAHANRKSVTPVPAGPGAARVELPGLG